MKRIRYIFFLACLMPSIAAAATTQYLGLIKIHSRPSAAPTIHRYSVNLVSSQKPFSSNQINPALNKITDLVYINKVLVNNTEYYRLVAGNFSTQKLARAKLRDLRKYYPGAWINVRDRSEVSALSSRLKSKTTAKRTVTKPKPKPRLVAPAPKPDTRQPGRQAPRKPPKDLAERLMVQARELFLDGNYARTLATTDKIAEIGNQEQREIALEMAGLVRERQNKLAQAAAIYTEFLELYPDSDMVPKIEARLEGLRTMFNDPSAPLANKWEQENQASWSTSGTFSQYYRNETLEIEGSDAQDLSELLLTDLYLVSRRRSRHSSLELRYDGGVVSDLLDEQNDGRTRQALVNYSNTSGGYQLIGGRQNRTARGVFSRFDGLVFNGNVQGTYAYSAYIGSPVQSVSDGLNDEQSFVGGSLHWDFSDTLDLDFYLMQQQVEDLTDRQAVGTELQYRNDRGFFYGILDYDTFHSELNNFTAVANFRYNDQLTFNTTFTHASSPLLSTYNAMIGQPVNEFSELQDIHGLSDQQVYDLALARSSMSTTLSINAAYELDAMRQLDFSMILSTIEASDASPATLTLPAIDASEEFESTHLGVDYSLKSYFIENDYTTFGARITDNNSAQVLSLRGRSRLPGWVDRLFFDPRIALDFRHNETSDVDQYILRTNLRVKYRPSRKWSLEGDLGWEYSDEDLPDNNTQTVTSFMLGFQYQF